MTTEHAQAAPSSADRIVNCTGSLQLEARYPEDEESEQAREGTAAHWALAEVLSSRAVAEGQIAPNGVVLTREMVEAAESVLRYVLACIAAHGEQPSIYRVEQRVGPGSRLPPAMWGTPDLVMFFPTANVLYILDFKFGFDWVEVFENWQLVAYLALVLDALEIDGLQEQNMQVRLVIDQPRSYHPDGPRRDWTLPAASDARALVNILAGKVEESLGPNARLSVGEHCDNCRARHACPALLQAGNKGRDRSRAATPFDLTPQALGLELADLRRAIKLLEARETGLAAQAQALIEGGGRVPFWSVERKPGRLAWTADAAQVFALGDMLGLDLRKAPEPITPTQAKEKGLDDEVLKAYAERPSVLKLVELEDAQARKVFS